MRSLIALVIVSLGLCEPLFAQSSMPSGNLDTVVVTADRPLLSQSGSPALLWDSKMKSLLRAGGFSPYIPGITEDVTRNFVSLEKTYVGHSYGGVPLLFRTNDLFRLASVHPLRHISPSIVEPSALYPGQDVVLLLEDHLDSTFSVRLNPLRQEVSLGNVGEIAGGVSLQRTGIVAREYLGRFDPYLTTIPRSLSGYASGKSNTSFGALALSVYVATTRTSLQGLAGFDAFRNASASGYAHLLLEDEKISVGALYQEASERTFSSYERDTLEEISTPRMFTVYSTLLVGRGSAALSTSRVSTHASKGFLITELAASYPVALRYVELLPSLRGSITSRKDSGEEMRATLSWSIDGKLKVFGKTVKGTLGVVHDHHQAQRVHDSFARVYPPLREGASVETRFASLESAGRHFVAGVSYKSILLPTNEGRVLLSGPVGHIGWHREDRWGEGFVSASAEVRVRALRQERSDTTLPVVGIARYEIILNADAERRRFSAFLNLHIRAGGKTLIIPDTYVPLTTGMFLTVGASVKVGSGMEVGITFPNLLRIAGYDSPIMAYKRRGSKIETVGVPTFPIGQVIYVL